jgi:hypothetical protein
MRVVARRSKSLKRGNLHRHSRMRDFVVRDVVKTARMPRRIRISENVFQMQVWQNTGSDVNRWLTQASVQDGEWEPAPHLRECFTSRLF